MPGLGPPRRLADKTGVTSGFSRALAAGRVLGHARGLVLAGPGVRDRGGGARAISDFRVLADQAEASGQVASVPTAYRTLEEIAGGGEKTARKLTAAVSTARRQRRGPRSRRGTGRCRVCGSRTRRWTGVTCIRIDATVTPAHPGEGTRGGELHGVRYRVLHAAARLVRGGRRKRWKFAANWPWTAAITQAQQRICALPDTT